MAFSVNGIGTTWYGHADEDEDGSYIVTEWITVVYIPILPLGSKRVWPVESDRGSFFNPKLNRQFQVAKVPLYFPHVLKAYGAVLGVFLFLSILDKCGK